MGRRLGLPFLDSDTVIEQRLGCSIREFFDREGEERFRDIEQNVIDDLSKHHHGVLSTGGGAVLRPLNRQHLHARGKVVYLRSTPEEVFRRLRHDVQRPLLQVKDPQEVFATPSIVRQRIMCLTQDVPASANCSTPSLKSCHLMVLTRTTHTTIQADHERFAHTH